MGGGSTGSSTLAFYEVENGPVVALPLVSTDLKKLLLLFLGPLPAAGANPPHLLQSFGPSRGTSNMTPVQPPSKLQAENSDCRRQRPCLPGVCISAKSNNATIQVLCVQFLIDMRRTATGTKVHLNQPGGPAKAAWKKCSFISILRDK